MEIPKMDIKYRKLTEIRPYERNPRRNDDAVQYVAESIGQFGFKVPIVIDKAGTIVAGHTRYKAAKKLKLKEVPCIVADDLTDEQIKAFRLADNKVGEFAEWDDELLFPELEDITGIDMTDFGFVFDELEEDNPYDIPGSEKGSLTEQFLVPPFSILDTRQGYWKERKRLWKDRIKDNGEARGDAEIISTTMSKGFADVSLLDPVLSEIIVRYFMPLQERGINCFDVFAGDTVFGYVASYLGKHFTGIELRQEQADFNNARVQGDGLDARYICDDGRNVLKHIKPETQDLLFSCPPYFDLEVYSDKPNDASNQATFDEFYAILDAAFTSAIKCLKKNRFAVIVVGDVRSKKDGGYYGFMDRVKETFRREGMLLYNEAILVDAAGTAAIRAARSMRSRKLVKTHQNVLVFYKGDPKAIPAEFGEVEISDGGEFDASDDV